LTAKAIAEEPKDVAADQVAVSGLVEDNSTAPPPEVLGRQEIQQIISQEMASSLVAMLPALLKEIQVQGTNGPSQHVHLGLVNDVASKPNYLKHYRRDGTVSGKYQLVDVSKLDDNGEIPVKFITDHNNHTRSESPATVKGKWVHFVNGEFYATTQQEVDFIEWKQKTDPQFRVYEVTGGGIIRCPVANCKSPGFTTDADLISHKRYAHGV